MTSAGKKPINVKMCKLSKSVVDFLTPLTFRDDAQRRACLLPLSGIYWDDEIPDFKSLLELREHDRNSILRLFSIRFKIWDNRELSPDEQIYWDEARFQVPDYALFGRLKLSAEDQQAQNTVLREAIEGIEVLFAGAKEIKFSEDEHGLSSFSANFDLTEEDK